jgi:hypothetical protein
MSGGGATSLLRSTTLAELKALQSRAEELSGLSSRPDQLRQTRQAIASIVDSKEKSVGRGLAAVRRAVGHEVEGERVVSVLRSLLREGVGSGAIPSSKLRESPLAVLERRGAAREATMSIVRELQQSASKEHDADLAQQLGGHLHQLELQDAMESWQQTVHRAELMSQATTQIATRTRTKSVALSGAEISRRLHQVFDELIDSAKEPEEGLEDGEDGEEKEEKQRVLTSADIRRALLESGAAPEGGVTGQEVMYVINRLDTNQKDGVLDFSEFRRAMEGRRPAREAFLEVLRETLEKVRVTEGAGAMQRLRPARLRAAGMYCGVAACLHGRADDGGGGGVARVGAGRDAERAPNIGRTQGAASHREGCVIVGVRRSGGGHGCTPSRCLVGRSEVTSSVRVVMELWIVATDMAEPPARSS